MKKILALALFCTIITVVSCGTGTIQVKDTYFENQTRNIIEDTNLIIKKYNFNTDIRNNIILFRGKLMNCPVGGRIDIINANPVYKLHISFDQYGGGPHDGGIRVVNYTGSWDSFWHGLPGQESAQEKFRDYLLSSLQSAPYLYKVIEFDNDKLKSLQEKNIQKEKEEYTQKELTQQKIWDATNKKSVNDILEFISSTDIEKLENEAYNALRKIISKGKFGGGYQLFKWGMSKNEVIAKCNENTHIKIISDEDNKIIVKEDENTAYSLEFQDGFLHWVEVAIQGLSGTYLSPNDKLEQILTKKYGHPVIEKKTENNPNGNGRQIFYTTYTWNDGFTGIYFTMSEYDVLWTNGQLENRWSYTEIKYYSTIIDDINLKNQQKEEEDKDLKTQEKL